MNEEGVLLTSDRDGVRTLTLNRPDRKNAINAAFAEKREAAFTGRWAVLPRSE